MLSFSYCLNDKCYLTGNLLFKDLKKMLKSLSFYVSIIVPSEGINCDTTCQKRRYRTFYENTVKCVFLLHILLTKCAENLKRFGAKLVIL